MSLRGSNAYEDRSVVFITGRNQPPIDDIEQQGRAVFGNSGVALDGAATVSKDSSEPL